MNENTFDAAIYEKRKIFRMVTGIIAVMTALYLGYVYFGVESNFFHLPEHIYCHSLAAFRHYMYGNYWGLLRCI